MATFVLVHAAWCSGWLWRGVEPRLHGAGHATWSPTLTGLGERAHLLSRSTGLATHVDDVVGLIEYEDLRAVVLVGHSYGGMVVTGVAERVPDRLARIIYVDAHVPDDGECGLDCTGNAAAFLERARSEGDGFLLPPPPVDDPAVARRLRPHPLKTLEDRLSVLNPTAARLPRTYVYCTAGKAGRSRNAQRALDRGWDFRELASGHMAPLEEPDGLANLLLLAADA